MEQVIAQRTCESRGRYEHQISKFLLLAGVSRHCLDYLKNPYEHLKKLQEQLTITQRKQGSVSIAAHQKMSSRPSCRRKSHINLSPPNSVIFDRQYRLLLPCCLTQITGNAQRALPSVSSCC